MQQQEKRFKDGDETAYSQMPMGKVNPNSTGAKALMKMQRVTPYYKRNRCADACASLTNGLCGFQ